MKEEKKDNGDMNMTKMGKVKILGWKMIERKMGKTVMIARVQKEDDEVR